MRPYSKIVAAFLLLLPVAACTPDSEPEPSVSAAATLEDSGDPVFDQAGLADLMARLTEDNNKANAALDSTAVALYEAEAAMEADQASLNATPSEYSIKPFTYEPVGSHIPGVLSGADFFVVESRTSFGGASYPLIMAKFGSEWRLSHYVGLEASLPEIKRDASGNAEVVDAADSTDTLIAAPRAVAEAHARRITDQPAEDPLFGADTTTGDVVNPEQMLVDMKFVRDNTLVPAESATYTSAVSKYPVRALRTIDGAAVVAYSTVTDIVGANPGRQVFIPQYRRKLGTNTGAGTQKLKRLTAWWVLVPVKGSALPVAVLGGKSTVIAVG
ncbi:hypothetical protein [Actinoplanes couchii]|uniref:DUF8094 domain-containing protein n=1 Tax=Actinoplanes couchii TaxID=403638 RepID=A0ABQ3XM78_9ACTN|nr:hypothetical protein [Actinoplanes couchii]MDR6319193.1 hypothetical protein [Actinoplanes couchii]GID59596.1 hypothetical protein Aco03nite_080000 [Actinoplanes couchii]